MHPAPPLRPLRSLRALRHAVLASFLPAVAFANLSSNPSFETGPDPGVTMTLAVGSTSVTGWVVTRNPIEYIGTRWNAAEGVRSISLNGTSPGGIAQQFSTTPGTEYTVRFMMASDAFANPVLKHMRVEAAGQSQDYEFDGTHAWEWDLGWLEHTFTFTASAATTTLEFYSLDAGDQGPALDHVIVESSATDAPAARRGYSLVASPNPARGAVSLQFGLPVTAAVRLSVWDVSGREVQQLAAGIHPAGTYVRRWEGAAAAPVRLAAGVYIVRLDAPGVAISRKVVIAR